MKTRLVHISDTNKVIRAWWWRPDKFPFNFGDELGAVTLRKLGFRVRRVPLSEAEVVITGTILDIAETENPNVTVVGSGSGYTHDSVHNFNVLLARGSLTAANLRVDVPLGDVGLLASRLWPKQKTQYGVGVVRHYVDTDEYPFADIVIGATERPEEVIRKISACRVVISSSLHGLIVADSYGIPNMRISRNDVITGDWKWMDYKTALRKPLADVQDDILRALERL